MLSLNCSDAGFDCTFRANGETEEHVIRLVIDHAKRDHQIKEEDISPEFISKIKNIIKDESK